MKTIIFPICILKIGSTELQAIIAKYIPLDDSKTFDAPTYSGKVELYDDKKNLEGTLVYENGVLKLLEPAPPTGGDENTGGGGGGSDWGDDGGGGTGLSGPYGGHSWVWQFFHMLFHGPDAWDSSGSNNSYGSTNNNSTTTIYFIDLGGQVMGQSTTTPSQTTSGNGAAVVPYENQWTSPEESTNQHMRVIRIGQRIPLTDEEKVWLRDSAPIETLILYSYLFYNPISETPEANAVALSAVKKMKQNPGLFKSMAPFLTKRQINDINLDPCSKGILNQIKNLQQNDISVILARFDQSTSPYVLNYSTVMPDNPLNSAETDWVRDANQLAIDNHYLIKIRPSYASTATRIAIARTLIHEMLHAHLLSIVDDLFITPVTDTSNFTELYDAIAHNTYDNDPNSVHHEQIARKYVDAMRDALQELDNSSEPIQFYQDLAWGGLNGTIIFNHLFPVGSVDRERILATNQAEDTNTPVVTPSHTYHPQSAPCI